ncbi:MAG: tetratricopeptide repeat protein [Acidobacteriota bacterium]
MISLARNRLFAKQYFEQALGLQEKVGNRTPVLLFNLGHVYSLLGDQEKALEYFRAARERSRETGQKQAEAFAFYGFGMAYRGKGDSAGALESYRQARAGIQPGRCPEPPLGPLAPGD